MICANFFVILRRKSNFYEENHRNGGGRRTQFAGQSKGTIGLLDKAKEQLGLDLRDAQLIYTGVGAINIIRSLAGLDRDAEVYNIGYAGSANFEIGTWVEVTEVRLNHPNVTYPEPELQLSPGASSRRNGKSGLRREGLSPITKSVTAFLIWSWLSSPRWGSSSCIA